MSDFAIAAVISQKDSENRLHPIAFYSRKLQAAELNYEVHDKELLAIIEAFKQWRQYLEATSKPTLVFSDHKNLEYFTTSEFQFEPAPANTAFAGESQLYICDMLPATGCRSPCPR